MPCHSGPALVSRQTGFTLIELLIVLVVAGIVAGLGFSAGQWIDRRHLDEETQALHQRLEALRQLTTATRREWQLCPLAPGGGTACGENWQAGYQWDLVSGDGGHLAGRHAVEGVTLDWNHSGNPVFASAPWQFHTAMGSFSLCNDSGGNRITINNAGRIRVEEGNDTGCTD
ncbi:GspH/FimT family pseudopilin [Salinicola avicenniae]|uniref:GspH/FimT family pseudopilin n=1 Tax=Salinicola avicenniae TaxID=2916836 RepID=UPI002073EA30|nr:MULTISPECIES: GspH/FimT family pseudopilin [unclassified Salinicola]